MSEQAVVARVQSFVADFHAAWSRAGSVPLPTASFGEDGVSFDVESWMQAAAAPDFEAWGRERQVLAEHHFVPDSRYAEDTSLSGKPEHDPSVERVLRVDVRRTRAEVQTSLPDGPAVTHHTFHLRLVEGDWRIDRIVRTSGPPTAPLVASSEVERLVGGMEPDLAGVPAPTELAHGVSGLFTRHRVVPLGSITTSGVLTAHDLGWVRFGLAPFHRRVPAGTYPVEVARDEQGTNLALRLRLSPADVVTRVPAVRVGTGEVVGVDAGNVAVLDFHAVTACSEAAVETFLQDWREDTVLSLTGGSPDGVAVRSGHGDGGYPMWWGLAQDGSVVDLVVDFLVAIEDVVSTVRVPLSREPVDHPDLEDFGIQVLAGDRSLVVRHRETVGSAHLREVRVLDAAGEQVTDQGGTFVQGGWCERTLRLGRELPDDVAGWVLEVEVSRGYRHL